MSELYLQHYGVLGMKWGVRRYRNEDGTLTQAGKERYDYAKEKGKVVTNPDGSKTFSSGFVFNRVAGQDLKFNESGGLYTSYGVEDATRYVRSMSRKLGRIDGQKAETIQHIKTTGTIKSPSTDQFISIACRAVADNPSYIDKLNKISDAGGFTANNREHINKEFALKASKNPKSAEAQRLAFVVNSNFAEPLLKDENKKVFDSFRKQNYDAVPDLQDKWLGSSKHPTIIINPNKVKLESKTILTKDIIKKAKKNSKKYEKLKAREIAYQTWFGTE